MMRKLITVCMVAILAFPLVNASALEKPDWREGDYWEYEVMAGGGRISEERIVEILGTENITVNNITYHCIVARDETNTSRETVYYDRESLGIVKEIDYDKETNETEEKIYDPPFSFVQYPISVGKEWNVTIEIESEKNSSGKVRFECMGKKKISVPAGIFNCHMIKTNHFPNESMSSYFYNVIYVSGRAGNIVMVESYFMGNLTYSSELTSFHYSHYSPGGEERPYPLIIVALAVIAIFISLVILSKFRGSK
ncbi:MAG: hypothetical protein U9O96_08630 [Candidatus Thermoplasmatota archaeon]|nr:hypothetical protein [Candidatus Thermoplasmatota archaeon]